MGTFLVRLGRPYLVHAFAVDPARGRVHPARCSASLIGGSLTLYAMPAEPQAGGTVRADSRAGARW